MINNPKSFEDLFRKELELFEKELPQYFPLDLNLNKEGKENFQNESGLQLLKKSIQYSLFSGGKRFRPVLTLLTAELLNTSCQQVIPLAVAVELIHTYSLIHDDLPVLDNDDFRRGKPTNHKIFGEDIALLAGDALLTEAFALLARFYRPSPQVGIEIILRLAQASGVEGMVGGQALDIKNTPRDFVDASQAQQMIREIHNRKTGALIAVSCEGAGLACGATETELEALKEYGLKLGLAFQLADDVLDFDQSKPESTSFINCTSLLETKKYLRTITDEGVNALKVFGVSKNEKLKQLIEFNWARCQDS